MPSHVEEQVQARIAAARRRAEERQQQRAELAAARTAGLAQRHAQRLRNQVNRGDTSPADAPVVAQTATTAGQSPKLPAQTDAQTATVATTEENQ